MKVLFLNRAFHPDVVATARYLDDVALELVRRGHRVRVVCGRRGYDRPSEKYLPHEVWNGIDIIRVGSTGFGKTAKWRRALDFGSFILNCFFRVLTLPRHDVVIALTSPPLISFVGALLTKIRGGRFIYWVMDLNPDEALEAGWLRQGSFAARLLERLSRFSLRHADRIVALDRFMRDRIVAKGIDPARIDVIAPWSQAAVCFDEQGRRRFRHEHGLEDKFVVMYSGNHSPCHPLDTLLEAARRLDADSRIVFAFIGGGSEFARVQQFARANGLGNVRCLPYQPVERLAGSLSAADLHVVVMGDAFVGTVHPCKIYNILNVGAPALYIGPAPSHIAEVLDGLSAAPTCAQVRHGDAAAVVGHIQRMAASGRRADAHRRLAACFSQAAVLPRFLAAIGADDRQSGADAGAAPGHELPEAEVEKRRAISGADRSG